MNEPEVTPTPEPTVEKSNPTPSFSGQLAVKFPTTNEELIFLPLQTQRGKLEHRWSYPSPAPALANEPSKLAVIERYTKLLGHEATVDAIEESLNRTCQNLWKLATDESVEKAPELFAAWFNEGKSSSGAITSAGLNAKATAFRKLFLEEKTKNGMTDLAKSYFDQAKKFQAEAIAAMEREMLEAMNG